MIVDSPAEVVQPDFPETGDDMGGKSTSEAVNWWADAFPQWKGRER